MIATKAVQTGVKLENILFATDFSPASNRALPFAVDLTRMFGGTLFGIHVMEPANYALPPETWQSTDAIRKWEAQELRERLEREIPRSNTLMLEDAGGLWASLAELVKENNIDLIVVGTRGRTGIGKMLLGSHAEELLRHAACPVLTVGPHVQSVGETRRKFASILFATDFGPGSAAAAALAVSMAQEAQAKLTVFHAVKKMAANDLAIPEQFAEADERKLREFVPDEGRLLCAPRYLVEEGEPAEKILEVARRTDADLIVLGVHKATKVPGAATHLPIATVHHIVAHAECPVLTVSR
jgi:nucleotide-binding universal stress UspA family protein